jgi:hypothetical protein
MKSTFIFTALITSILTMLARPAAAVTMTVTPLDIHQKGVTSEYTVGHFIDARTTFQNLTLTGGFTVTCYADGVIPPVNYEVTQSQLVLNGNNVLSMGVPTNLPASRSVSGWYNIRTGSVFPCSYDYTARAVESGINFGSGGSSVPIGGGQRFERGTIAFDMMKVGAFPGPGCIF